MYLKEDKYKTLDINMLIKEQINISIYEVKRTQFPVLGTSDLLKIKNPGRHAMHKPNYVCPVFIAIIINTNFIPVIPSQNVSEFNLSKTRFYFHG